MPNDNNQEKIALTKAQAAKAVHRLLPALNDKGQPRLNKNDEVIMRKVAVGEDEVMSFAEYDDRIVVVTMSGEKLSAEKA